MRPRHALWPIIGAMPSPGGGSRTLFMSDSRTRTAPPNLRPLVSLPFYPLHPRWGHLVPGARPRARAPHERGHLACTRRAALKAPPDGMYISRIS